MLIDILLNFLFQFLNLFGIVIIVCFAVGICQRLFYKQLGASGHNVGVALGVIGTPIHECGHALMCLLFGHKITEMVLFQLNSEDGTLGYVSHSYNPKNPFHLIGGFFIAIGPIILGTAILTLLMVLLRKDLFYNIIEMIESNSYTRVDLHDSQTWLLLGKNFIGVLSLMFASQNFISLNWWIYMAISFAIALHMGLSNADIRNGIIGLLALTGALLVVNIILCLIGGSFLSILNRYILIISSWIFSFLAISMVMSIFIVLSTYIIRHTFRLIKFKRW